MDASGQLLSRIIDDERITEVIKSGVTEDFMDDSAAVVYKHILRHFSDYKSVPSRSAVLKAFPNFEFKEAKEPLEYYIDQLKEARRQTILEENLKEAARVYMKDTRAAEEHIRTCLAALQITEKSFKDVSVIESIDDILQEYDDKKNNPGVDGIRSHWAAMDEETLGWHPGEFIVLAGEKYMGKSWLMIDLALIAALQGERVCFITREMAQTQVRRRLVSIIGRVPFDSLRKGILTEVEETRFKKAMQTLDKNFHFHIAQNGVYTVDDMERKAIEKDATIMFTDSVYLFMPDSKFGNSGQSGEVQKRMAISQKCKLVAQNLKIPFVVSVQAGRNRKKASEPPTLDNIEWSNAFSQDGDTVFFTQKDDVDKEMGRSQIWLLKSRDGQIADFFINQDFEHMDFSQRADKREPTTQVFTTDEEETLY